MLENSCWDKQRDICITVVMRISRHIVSVECASTSSTSVKQASDALYHNTSVSYTVSTSREVETYRGNIVFALTRPAQPKQLLQWTLGWTLLRGKTHVCRITIDTTKPSHGVDVLYLKKKQVFLCSTNLIQPEDKQNCNSAKP